jgi:polyhydroxyalkanoate synthesis regulator phasin
MNTTIYATILTGLGIVITLIVAMVNLTNTMVNLSKANQQETNRRIDELRQETNRRTDELKHDLKELFDAKFKVVEVQITLVNANFQKLDRDVADLRQEVQELKRVMFKTTV